MMDVSNTKMTAPQLAGRRIVVDLTPMLPGGENGGAKLMTVELLDALARLLPRTEFVLLTAQSSHSELDWLEQGYANVRRTCVLHNNPQANPGSPFSPKTPTWKEKMVSWLTGLASDILPSKIKQRIRAFPSTLSVWSEKILNRAKSVIPLALRQGIKRLLGIEPSTPGSGSFLRVLGADLLFCPFTAPFYADSQTPTVSVIYDLQHRAYPEFFTQEEAIERENNFRIACQKADYLVTISKFVRETVIEAADCSPERVIAVQIGLLRAPTHVISEKEMSGDELLKKYGLQRSEYLFYPANFWQHKNHAMLLTAFKIYREANPASSLKLLCTGAPGGRAEAFCDAVRRMGLAHWVVYPGYVSSQEYDSFLRSAFAMIFPSLYEGFGIPVLEAMYAGVPVMCSNLTSLPEVGGDSVLYFDPRRPGQIIDTLFHLYEEPGLREELINKGMERAIRFTDVDRMALEYADVFAKALLRKTNDRLHALN